VNPAQARSEPQSGLWTEQRYSARASTVCREGRILFLNLGSFSCIALVYGSHRGTDLAHTERDRSSTIARYGAERPITSAVQYTVILKSYD
jgi:hypothetical protein